MIETSDGSLDVNKWISSADGVVRLGDNILKIWHRFCLWKKRILPWITIRNFFPSFQKMFNNVMDRKKDDAIFENDRKDDGLHTDDIILMYQGKQF